MKKANIDKGITGTVSRRGIVQGGLVLAAAGLVGGSWLLSSSASLAASETPVRGGVLKIGVGGGSSSDPADPALIAAPATRLLVRQWGDTLTQLSEAGELQGRLAETFSSDPEAKVWTFKIREGVKFHDGRTLTAEDVAETFRRHGDEASQSTIAPLMAGMETLEANGSELRITLKSPNADLPYLLTDYHLPIQPAGGRDNPGAMIGTGPYKVDVAEPGVRYVLSRNTDDWNSDRGFYDSIEIYVINDSTARTSALTAGQVHMINLIPPRNAEALKGNEQIVLQRTPSRSHYAFEAMVNTPPFNNKDLLLALKYALPREEIREKVLFGYATLGNDIPINESYPLYRPVLQQRPLDLEKAAAHYKASGHDGSPIVLNVAEAVFPGAVDAALLWQQSCQNAGIPLEVKRVPDDGYWQNVANVEPFVADNYLGRPVQDQQYSIFYQSGGEWNMTRFSNEEFDKLIGEARGEVDEERRADLYAKASEILWEEGGAFIPVFTDFLDGTSGQVAGWRPISTDEFMGGYAPSLTWFA